MWSYLQFRYRRATRRARRNLFIYRKWASNYTARHLYGKWHQIKYVRRFLLVWGLIIAVAVIGVAKQIGALDLLASIAVAEPGGTYSEAALGTVNVLNPVLPESDTTADINSLIFSGLTRRDASGGLVPDLATSWSISTDGKTYTFHLRHGVKWQDGVPFTSADVAFTLTAIQNPDSRSPLASSWQDVTVATPDEYTVTFTLPEPLTSFLQSTTLGIIPRHLLENTDPSQLAEAGFNQDPIGTGPFELKTFAPANNGQVDLVANPDYYFGKPKLDGFDFNFYSSAADALQAYEADQVTSIGRIEPENSAADLKARDMTSYTFTLPQEQTLFFSTIDPVLSDKTLRTIISTSLNRSKIMQAGDGGQGMVVTQPILPGQLGYTDQYAQSPISLSQAQAALSSDGWTQGKKDATRVKNGTKLVLSLVTLQGGEQERVAAAIKSQLAPLGINVAITAVDETGLEQSYMRPRNFQMLLYGINIGADPDVYAFWHSSQAKDPGVNLSSYSSDSADKALESGRIVTDPATRAAKYHEFLAAWNQDEPAAVLYQEGYVYGVNSEVMGIAANRLITPSDRFYDVQRWTVRQRFEFLR
jgi:peptide/nickel transport system substrate-binding protein